MNNIFQVNSNLQIGNKKLILAIDELLICKRLPRFFEVFPIFDICQINHSFSSIHAHSQLHVPLVVQLKLTRNLVCVTLSLTLQQHSMYAECVFAKSTVVFEHDLLLHSTSLQDH